MEPPDISKQPSPPVDAHNPRLHSRPPLPRTLLPPPSARQPFTTHLPHLTSSPSLPPSRSPAPIAITKRLPRIPLEHHPIPAGHRSTTRVLRRNASHGSLPVDKLAHKLGKQSLRASEHPYPLPNRISSIDLPNTSSFHSIALTIDALPEIDIDAITASGQSPLPRLQHQDVEMRDVGLLYRPPSAAIRDAAASTSSPGGPSSRPSRRESYIQPLPEVDSLTDLSPSPSVYNPRASLPAPPQVTRHTCPILEADENYCEGEDDFSWLESQAETIGLPSSLRKRGMLRYQSSQDVALRSSNLVRNQTRMRKRRLKRRESRSYAESYTGSCAESYAESYADSLMGSLAGSISGSVAGSIHGSNAPNSPVANPSSPPPIPPAMISPI